MTASENIFADRITSAGKVFYHFDHLYMVRMSVDSAKMMAEKNVEIIQRR